MRLGDNDVFRIDGVLSVVESCRIDVDSLRHAFMWKMDPDKQEYTSIEEIYLDMEILRVLTPRKSTNVDPESILPSFWGALNKINRLSNTERGIIFDGIIVNGKTMFIFTPGFFKFKKM